MGSEDIKKRVLDRKNQKRNPHRVLMGEQQESNINTNVNTNKDNSDTYKKKSDDIVADFKNKNSGKTSNDLVGIYFDPDIKRMLAKQQDKNGRGFKSYYVNELVRRDMESKGWL